MKKLSQQKVNDFESRSRVNSLIQALEDTRFIITRLRKIVFQSGRLCESITNKLLEFKKLSSFPKIRSYIIDSKKYIYDSPWKFFEMCNLLLQELDKNIKSLKREVNNFSNRDLPEAIRNWSK